MNRQEHMLLEELVESGALLKKHLKLCKPKKKKKWKKDASDSQTSLGMDVICQPADWTVIYEGVFGFDLLACLKDHNKRVKLWEFKLRRYSYWKFEWAG